MSEASFGRRLLLRRLGASLVDGASRTVVPAPPLREYPRPPGALLEPDFLAACTRCSDCIEACPHKAIGVLPEEAGVAAGTPAMAVDARPCHLCEGLPCVAACETGALIPTDRFALRFGVAEIDESRCFTFMGPECGACAPACPTPALTMVAGKPRIDSESCTGCGLCREACPVFGKAIRIEVFVGSPGSGGVGGEEVEGEGVEVRGESGA